MSDINFDLPADIFWAKTGRRLLPKGGVGHQRCTTLAEAICCAVEDQSAKRFGISIETDEDSFSMEEIAAVYQSDEFIPYRRQYGVSPSAQQTA